MMINGTDFQIQHKGVIKKGKLFGSHKYSGKLALRHVLGVDDLAGNLVWVGGPYPTGAWPDLKIFNNVLLPLLKPGKRIKANNGYIGRPDKIKCSHNNCNPAANLGMQSVARSCHKTYNGRLKNWGILEKVYRHNITVHGMVFYACTVITQLSVVTREPLFEVEHGDN
jgi:hypothetical protein